LDQVYESVILVSDGANWHVTAQGATSPNAWILDGNSVASLKNFGTVSNFDLPFITNNTEKMRLSATGNLGIGTPTFNATYPEKLVVDAGATTSVNAIVGKGNINNYLQLNIQNSNAGTNASSDVVATADNGSETTNFVDMGINSSVNTSGVMGAANDAYLYNIGQNFLLGTGTAAKSLVFMTGGTAQATNERMRISGTGNVGIGFNNPGYKLQVSAASNPLYLAGVQTGLSTDSILMILNGVVRKLHPSALVTSSSNAWALIGNSGTVPGTNFIGTIDNQSLVFKANNILSGKIDLTLNNTSFGYQAAQGVVTGNGNTYLGYQSGFANTSGASNVGVGSIALNANTSGSSNTAVGYSALKVSTTASNNVSIGNSSLALTSTGSGNTALGSLSGGTNTTGSNNTFIGNSADATVIGLSNATAIGYNAKVATNNTLILGGLAANTVNVGIGTNTFNATYPEKFVVDAGATTSVNAIVGKGSINNYLQLNIQNSNAGTNASSDVVATADNGSETTNFVDMGINSSVNTSGIMGAANDAYLYNIGQNFLLGTGTVAKSLVFITGGTTQATNERMRVDGSGNVGIATNAPAAKLDVSGTYKLGTAGTVLTNMIKTSFNINDATTFDYTVTNQITVTVTGATVNATVIINPRTALPTGLGIGWARVSSANTVIIGFTNTDGTARAVGNITFDVTVIQ